MKEAIIYLIAAIAAITIFGYSVHMFIGGLVPPETEQLIIIGACLVAAAIITFLAWDVIKRRRAQ